MRKFFMRLVACHVLICLMISPVALAYEDELAKGSKGDAVVELQERLNLLGYSVGTADGDFGNKTYNAVVSYQAYHGLDSTGIVTVELQKMMEMDVSYLEKLSQLGYVGTELKSVVAEYQENNRIENTGILDEATMLHIDTEIKEKESIEAVVADLVIVDAAYPDPHTSDIAGCFGYASISTGEIVIPCEWTYLRGFSEGLACVGKENKYGYIDTEGNIVIPVKFEEATSFREGLAAVKMDGKWGYIDKNGNVIIDFSYEDASVFSQGLAAVQLDGLWGYIDMTGELKIDCQWETAEIFSAGSAVVGNRLYEELRYGLINTSGDYILEIKYESIYGLSDGMRRVEDGFGRCGFVDKEGDIVIPCEWENAYPFTEGLAAVKIDGKWGYIDKMGNSVIPCLYEDAEQFSEGLASVRSEDNGYYYINTEGEKTIETNGKWMVAGWFNNGLAYIEDYKSNKAGYINTNGEMCIATNLDCGIGEYHLPIGKAGSYMNNGVCAVVLPDAETVSVDGYKYARISYVNTEGQIVIKDAGWSCVEYNPDKVAKYGMTECYDIAINDLKGRLKNPESLQMHDVS